MGFAPVMVIDFEVDKRLLSTDSPRAKEKQPTLRYQTKGSAGLDASSVV